MTLAKVESLFGNAESLMLDIFPIKKPALAGFFIGNDISLQRLKASVLFDLQAQAIFVHCHRNRSAFFGKLSKHYELC
jgi:hypothetical protein